MRAIKEDIKNFLGEKLKLTLSEEKTLITHGNQKAKFLGYEIYVRPFTDKTLRSEKSGVLMKAYGKKVVLEIPMSTMRDKLLYYEAMKIYQFEGKAKWKPTSRTKMLHQDDLEILDAYNRGNPRICKLFFNRQQQFAPKFFQVHHAIQYV